MACLRPRRDTLAKSRSKNRWFRGFWFPVSGGPWLSPREVPRHGLRVTGRGSRGREPSARPLGEDPIVRLILDGTVVRVRLDRRATSISLLVALGVRADGKKVLLAIRSMGGESEGAWRALLDDLIKRGLRAEDAGFGHRRRRAGPGKGAGGAVARRAGPALHGSKTPQSPGSHARAAARGRAGTISCRGLIVRTDRRFNAALHF